MTHRLSDYIKLMRASFASDNSDITLAISYLQDLLVNDLEEAIKANELDIENFKQEINLAKKLIASVDIEIVKKGLHYYFKLLSLNLLLKNDTSEDYVIEKRKMEIAVKDDMPDGYLTSLFPVLAIATQLQIPPEEPRVQSIGVYVSQIMEHISVS